MEDNKFITIGNLGSRRESIIKGFLNNNDLEKARTGVYSDNPTNRKLNRVGQKYGTSAKKEEPKGRSAKKEDVKGGKAKGAEQPKGGKGAIKEDFWRQHLSDDPDNRKAQLAGMMDRVVNASIDAENKGDQAKADKLMEVYDEMRTEMSGGSAKKEQPKKEESKKEKAKSTDEQAMARYDIPQEKWDALPEDQKEVFRGLTDIAPSKPEQSKEPEKTPPEKSVNQKKVENAVAEVWDVLSSGDPDWDDWAEKEMKEIADKLTDAEKKQVFRSYKKDLLEQSEHGQPIWRDEWNGMQKIFTPSLKRKDITIETPASRPTEEAKDLRTAIAETLQDEMTPGEYEPDWMDEMIQEAAEGLSQKQKDNAFYHFASNIHTDNVWSIDEVRNVARALGVQNPQMKVRVK